MADYLSRELPPELILLLSPSLPSASLNALALTSRRLRETLQQALDSRITPEYGLELLLWAAASKPHIVAKLVAEPYCIHPTEGYGEEKTPLHIAAEEGQTEIVALLLDAGGDVESIWPWNESQPLHHAVQHNAVRTVKLLLDRGAPVNTVYDWEMPTTSLLWACHEGHLEMLNTLLDHGADTESKGFNGTALGFALHMRHTNIIQVLLKHGAKAEASVPLNGSWLAGGPPPPYSANLLYLAMGSTHPRSEYSPEPPPREGRRERMALLLAYGASKAETMKIIRKYLRLLAEAAECTEEQFLIDIQGFFREAEAAIGEVTTRRRMWEYRAKERLRKCRRFIASLPCRLGGPGANGGSIA